MEKQTLGGHKQNLVSTRTQKKGALTPQETDPDLPVRFRSIGRRHGSSVACCRSGALSAAVYAWGLLREVALVFIMPTVVWPGRTAGRDHSPAVNRKLDQRFTEHGPAIRTRPRSLLGQSLPLGSFHKPLILLHQRADRLETTIAEN